MNIDLHMLHILLFPFRCVDGQRNAFSIDITIKLIGQKRNETKVMALVKQLQELKKPNRPKTCDTLQQNSKRYRKYKVFSCNVPDN